VFVKIINNFFLVLGVVTSDSWCLPVALPLHCVVVVVVVVVVVELSMEAGRSQRDVNWHDEKEV
jgi:hypothetical protein